MTVERLAQRHAPRGWRVLSGGADDVSVVEPGGAAAAMRRTRRLPEGAAIGRWLAHDFAAGEPGLQPARTLLVDERSATLACAAIDYGGQLFRGRAGVVALREGDLVSLFIAAAPCERYAACLPRLVRILESLRPRSDAAASLDLADLLRFGAGPRGALPRSTHPLKGSP
jgi:hypothetical protein